MINAGPRSTGLDYSSLRIDVSIRRDSDSIIIPGGTGARLDQDRLVLRHMAGESWEPVALTPVAGTGNKLITGVVGATHGSPLPVGTSRTERLQIEAPGLPSVQPGNLIPAVTLSVVDPATGSESGVIATNDGHTLLIAEDRLATTIRVGGARQTDPIQPHTLRQGQTARLSDLSVQSPASTSAKHGVLSIYVDGHRAQGRNSFTAFEQGYVLDIPYDASDYQFVIPEAVRPGTRTVRVHYSGSTIFLPSEWTGTIEVLPARGAMYDCRGQSLSDYRFTADVTAQARFPTVSPADTVGLSLVDVRLYIDRGPTPGIFVGQLETLDGVNPVREEGGLRSVAVDIGPNTAKQAGTALDVSTLAQG